MKQNIFLTNGTTVFQRAIILAGAMVPMCSHAITTILSDDFGSGSVAETFRVYESRIDNGWSRGPFSYAGQPASEWVISGGVASNASSQAATGYPLNKAAEAPLYNFFSGAGTIEPRLRISFDYSVGAGDQMYVHLWGMTGVSDFDNQFVSNIEGSSNGNVNLHLNPAVDSSDELTVYNLNDGAASGFGGTATSISGALTGSGHFAQTIRLSDLGISGVNTAADLDYYLVQFAQEENGLAGITSIDNFRLMAVPEPSSTVLLGLGGLALILRRRK